LVDQVIREPLGGAHRDPDAMAERLREALRTELLPLLSVDSATLLERRYQRLMRYGRFKQ